MSNISLNVQKHYVHTFANGAINPSAKVVEMINSRDYGDPKELVTQANDVLFRPFAMAVYGGATDRQVESLIESSKNNFNHWMDAARMAINRPNPIPSIASMNRAQLIELQQAIAQALGEDSSETPPYDDEFLDGDDFS